MLEVLVSRLSDRGDASFLRAQVTAQLRALKCEEEARSREVLALKREVEIPWNSMQPGYSSVVTSVASGTDIRMVESASEVASGSLEKSADAMNAGPGVSDCVVPSSLPRSLGPAGSERKTGRSDREGDRLRGKSVDLDSATLGINTVIVSDIDDASIDEVLYNLIELRNARRPCNRNPWCGCGQEGGQFGH